MSKNDKAKKKLYPIALDEMARVILDWIGSLDPGWKMQIDYARQDHNWSSLQALGSWVAYVLDHQLQNSISSHPALAPGWVPEGGSTNCQKCGRLIIAEIGGQRFCRPSCSEANAAQGIEHGQNTEPSPAN